MLAGSGVTRPSVRGRARGFGRRPVGRAQPAGRGRRRAWEGSSVARGDREGSRLSTGADGHGPRPFTATRGTGPPFSGCRPGGATAVPSRSPGVTRSADLSCQPSGRRCCGVCPKASGLGVECCSVAGLCVQPGSLRLPGLVQGHLARDGCAPSLQHLRPSSLKTDLFAIPPLDSLSLSVLQPTSLIHHIWKGVLRTELNFLCIQWRHSVIPCFSTVWFKAAKANIWKESWRGLVGIWGLSRDPWGNHGKLSSLSSVASPA